jgi:hypothetical protein
MRDNGENWESAKIAGKGDCLIGPVYRSQCNDHAQHGVGQYFLEI